MNNKEGPSTKAPAGTSAPIRRSPRHARVSRSSIRLTDDCLRILREIYRHRVLTTDQILRLSPARGSKHLQHRLRSLYDHGFVDRIKDAAPAGINPPMIYALGNRGAEALGIRRLGVDWAEKNRSYGLRQLKHVLLVNEVCVGVQWSCFIHQVRFISPEEILEHAPEKMQALARPYQWRVSVSRPDTSTTRETVRPDYIFGLQFPNHPTTPGAKRYYMLEADRGTEPQRRTEPRGQYAFRRLESIGDKLYLYLATLDAWRNGTEVKPFGFTNFFTLIVTDRGRQRVANMVAESKRVTRGTGEHSHRFADTATIEGSGDVLTMPWLTGKGESMPLVDWLVRGKGSGAN